MYYQYMILELDLDNRLRALGSDQDVHDLSRYVLLGHKLINVYIEHEQTSLDTYNPSPFKKYTIIELEDDEPVPNSKIAKQLIVANGMGKNNVPSEFADDLYFVLDNENFDHFYDLDDAKVLVKANEVEQTLERGIQAQTVVDKGKKVIVDDESNEGSGHSDQKGQSGDEVEVDMKDFHDNVDVNTEFMGSGNLGRIVVSDYHVYVDVEIFDNDEFDSGKEIQLKKNDKAKAVKDIIKFKAVEDKIKWNKSRIINGGKPNKSKENGNKCPWALQISKDNNETCLLTVVSLDPNNGIYPLAYGIAEAETKESWTSFLEQLAEDLDLEGNSNFTLISDKEKAIAELFPATEHRYCLKHIHENMKQGGVVKFIKICFRSVLLLPLSNTLIKQWMSLSS
ncbi:mutator type transposase [Tanacetum coccineum]